VRLIDQTDGATLNALTGQFRPSWLFEAQPTLERRLPLNSGVKLPYSDYTAVSNAARQLLPRFRRFFLIAEGLTGNLGDPNVSDIERERLRGLIDLFGEWGSLGTPGVYDHPRLVPFYWRAYLHTHRAAIDRGHRLDYKAGKYLGKLLPDETRVRWRATP
jgi:hypothetical protein